ncbi:MAG: glycosyltransferase [Alistipes sp.]|nr:glycosyltransferase [Candidatus Alistipes equi]
MSSQQTLEPLVSVCITAYNHEKYIAKAIQGALSQQCSFPYEIVIGVDISTDKTLQICKEFEKAHPQLIRVLERDHRLGMRGNYHDTINACRGKYIAMLDGDDWWREDDKLQLQADALERDTQAGMCYTFSRREKENGEYTIYPETKPTTDYKKMILSNPAENCATMARRDIIMEYYREIVPENHPEWLTDDLPMWFYVAGRMKVIFIARESAVHRILSQSGSHFVDYKKTIAFCDSLVNISLFYDKRNLKGKQHLKLVYKRENDALWLLSFKGTNREFLSRWWKDIVRDPILILNPVPYVLFLKKIFYRNFLKP